MACMNEDSLHQDLSSYLQAREERDRYRVDAVLKESPFEITQRVYRCNPDGSEDGPYVRKIFSGEADKRQVGGTYGLLWREQQAGGEMPNLPRLYGVYDAIDSLEVLMEYVGGTSLRSRILAHPERRMALTATVFPQVCDAVASLHDALAGPIIHRDITPSNVMCDGADDARVRAILVDFGVARVHKREATADTAHFGTAAYAAPEQYGFRQTDVRTDVYGLGALLSFCLMARDPVQSGGEGECCLSGAPEALAAVARKAMAFDPDDRYQTARELKEAFLCALEGRVAPRAQQGSSVPAGVGVAWNVLLLILFVTWAASIGFAWANMPLLLAGWPVGMKAFLFVVFAALFFVFPAVLVWFSADKRRLRRRFPRIDRGSTRRNVPILLVALAVCLLLFGLLWWLIRALGLQ